LEKKLTGGHIHPPRLEPGGFGKHTPKMDHLKTHFEKHFGKAPKRNHCMQIKGPIKFCLIQISFKRKKKHFVIEIKGPLVFSLKN